MVMVLKYDAWLSLFQQDEIVAFIVRPRLVSFQIILLHRSDLYDKGLRLQTFVSRRLTSISENMGLCPCG